MKMPTHSEADKLYFRSIVPDDPRVQVKPMFGSLGAFVNGNMFMGLFGTDIGVKLDQPALEELRAAGGGPFGPEERPMGGYASLPAAWRDDAATTERWVARSLEHVGSLPPKKK